MPPATYYGNPFPGNLRPLRRGGLPPSLAPLMHNPFTPVCRGRACPARSLTLTPFSALHPFSPRIVGRGLDRLTAHNERRQPAKLARSCGCLPRRGQTLFAPRFRSAQPWPHAHNPAPPRGVGDAAPYIFAANLLAACRGGIHPSRLPQKFLLQNLLFRVIIPSR